MPIRTQTSVGMETPDETTARARELLARSQNQVAGDSPAVASPIQSPTPATQMQPTGDISIPSPEAPAIEEEFLNSVQGQVQQTRQTVEQSLQQRRQEIEEERAELISQRDQIMQDDVQPLTEPFREELERTERERLKVNENFEANQRLVGELEQLLTEGNNLIRMQQGLPVNQRVVNARMNNAMRDVEARAGVLQAVMNARNNQISQALTMIDRTKEAIVADRQDQLNYFTAILGAKDQKILQLDKEDEKMINEQLSLIKQDFSRAEATSDYLKQLMVDPNTAQFIADAGITMTDSVEEVNQKMAEQRTREDIQEITNQLTLEGFTALPQSTGGANEIELEIDGKTLYFRRPPVVETATSGGGSGTGTTQFDRAYDVVATYLGQNPTASETELVNRIRQMTNLNVGDAQRVAREVMGSGESSFQRARQIADELYSTQFNRTENEVVNQIREAMNIPVGDAQRIAREARREARFIEDSFFRTQFTQDELETAAIDSDFYSRGGFLWSRKDANVDDYITALMEEVERQRRLGSSDMEIAQELGLL